MHAHPPEHPAAAVLSHPWMRWHYSPQQWQAWIEARVERLRGAPAAGWIKAGSWNARWAGEKLRLRLSRTAPDSYFGGDGVICEGAFTSFLGPEMFLTAASMDHREPRALLMEFELLPRFYRRVKQVKLQRWVLIPAGCDPGDLSLLRTALRSRCPTAKIEW